jgi:hypothetical protein
MEKKYEDHNRQIRSLTNKIEEIATTELIHRNRSSSREASKSPRNNNSSFTSLENKVSIIERVKSEVDVNSQQINDVITKNKDLVSKVKENTNKIRQVDELVFSLTLLTKSLFLVITSLICCELTSTSDLTLSMIDTWFSRLVKLLLLFLGDLDASLDEDLFLWINSVVAISSILLVSDLICLL